MKKLFFLIGMLAMSIANVNAQSQAEKDDAILQKFFKDTKVKAQKTASGLYYVILQKGTGENAKAGQQVTVNYTGRTMEGNVFDSNTDPKFMHVEPFTFSLGGHQVIAGWDEGIALLNKGAKAILYIPSPMAYGAASPSAAIPPNSIMIFDVELLDAK
jgi:FKBP-type peptidyl-prolyl cis-trans isomerase